MTFRPICGNPKSKNQLIARSGEDNSSEMASTSESFIEKYLDRIGLEVSLFDTLKPPDLATLGQLTEAHLNRIPFENLAQHGGYGGNVRLNLDWISDKILNRRRGGFCLELNALFGSLLTAWGLAVVLVPAIVYKEEQGGFDHPATHMFLVVTATRITPETSETTATRQARFFVDVGFGEPPCNPLCLDEYGKEQITAEGMKSRIVESEGKVVLEWWKDGGYKPRLQWNLADTLVTQSPRLEDFQSILDLVVHNPQSIFSRKLIVCRLTHNQKFTLSGATLKVTGPPRWNHDANTDGEPGGVQIQIFPIETWSELRDILATRFGICLEETQGLLDLRLLAEQDPNLFANF